ncbi:MAG TPA: type II secretion system F family protein [Kineosporiaceae bacterium]|nr:type II secretion system F family protein [Kineosporiaceae bacterium]
MGIVVGLLFGIGAFCIWWSFWVPDAPRERRRGGRADRARDVLAQAGIEGVTPQALLLACGALAAAAFLGVFAVSRSPQIAACFAVMAGWAPVAGVHIRARHRRAVRRELWPEVVDNIASGVRAGLSLPEALTQVGERGPEALRAAFVAFGQDYRASGRFGEALERLKDRLADPVADRICEALRITREVGGCDLGRLLRSLSAFLREDARTRAELEARQSWTVNGARLAVAAPWAVLGLLATRPESVRAYNSATGALVLAVGATVCVVAYRVMLRIGRLPEEERVLR